MIQTNFPALIEQPTHVTNFKPVVSGTEYLQKYGLDWTVYKDPLICESDGSETDFVTTRRSDTHSILGMVKNSYEAFQNEEMMLLIDSACQETGVNMHNAGSLKNGNLVYIQAHSGDTHIGNDQVKKYISVLNSHDGSTSLKWGLSNITVICQNTFFGAFRQLGNSARHTANMRDKVRDLVLGLQSAKKDEVKLYDLFSRMADKKIDLKAIEAVTTAVLDLEKLDDLKLEDISTRKKNMANDFSIVMEKELASHGSTYWGALSAATYWTTHSATTKERGASKMAGELHRIDGLAFSRLVNLINNN